MVENQVFGRAGGGVKLNSFTLRQKRNEVAA